MKLSKDIKHYVTRSGERVEVAYLDECFVGVIKGVPWVYAEDGTKQTDGYNDHGGDDITKEFTGWFVEPEFEGWLAMDEDGSVMEAENKPTSMSSCWFGGKGKWKPRPDLDGKFIGDWRKSLICREGVA